MARRKHTAEQVINKLREAEVLIGKGNTVAEVSRSWSDAADLLPVEEGVRGDEDRPGRSG